MKTIFLEFKHEGSDGLAANGSDMTMHLDGRWGQTRIANEVWDRVYELRNRNPKSESYKKQLFVGYTISQYPGQLHVRMYDRTPPAWAKS